MAGARCRIKPLICAVIVLAAWQPAAGAPPRLYEVTVILAPTCPVTGLPATIAYGLNDLGVVAGSQSQCLIGGDGYLDANVWSAETGLVTLPRPNGYSDAAAVDINNLGQAVGYIESANQRAALWQNDEVINLGIPFGADWSYASAINDSGQVVGGWIGTFSGMRQGFIWQDGVMTDLGPILGSTRSEALDISNAGHVTGWTSDAPAATGQRTFVLHDEIVTELPAISGEDWSRGRAVNNRGHVGVNGYTSVDGTITFRAYLWDTNQFTNLGTLPGTTSTGIQDLNDRQQIVGNCYGIDGSTPYIWEDGVMTDLRDLVPARPGFVLSWVSGINQFGQITANGRHQGDTVGLLLTPKHCPWDCDNDGNVGITDLLALLGQWDSAGPCDFDGGGVGTTDFQTLIANWGPCPDVRHSRTADPAGRSSPDPAGKLGVANAFWQPSVAQLRKQVR